MKIAALAILAISASASASTGVEHLLAKKPKHSFASARNIAAIEGCLGPKVTWSGDPSIIHGDGRTDIILSHGGEIVSLFTSESGSRVELREIFPIAKLRKNIESCL